MLFCKHAAPYVFFSLMVCVVMLPDKSEKLSSQLAIKNKLRFDNV